MRRRAGLVDGLVRLILVWTPAHIALCVGGQVVLEVYARLKGVSTRVEVVKVRKRGDSQRDGDGS